MICEIVITAAVCSFIGYAVCFMMFKSSLDQMESAYDEMEQLYKSTADIVEHYERREKERRKDRQ